MKADFLGRGGVWLDAGTINDYYDTSAFVAAIENRQGLKVACLEEIAYSAGFISKQELSRLIDKYPDNEYGHYLQSILDD